MPLSSFWGAPHYVCSLITEAVRLDKETVRLTFKGKQYTFRFHEKSIPCPDRTYLHGLLELFLGENRVLALNAAFNDEDKYNPDWSIFGIEAFVEGDWIGDFREMADKVESERVERERRKREDPQKLEKLKKDFGIQ